MLFFVSDKDQEGLSITIHKEVAKLSRAREREGERETEKTREGSECHIIILNCSPGISYQMIL